jgi:hypothetical protein
MRNASESRLGATAAGGVTARYSAWGGTEDWSGAVASRPRLNLPS